MAVNLRSRYMRATVLMLSLKLFVSAWVYYLVVQYSAGTFQTFWMINARASGSLAGGAPSWPFLFQGWDSGFYVFIANSGYKFSLYAFLPGYPGLIRLVSYLLRDSWAAAALVALTAGVLWVPVFLKVAECYLPEQDAFEATILAATSPYVFVFTTVAYTEGLFLLATVSAWYLHLKGRYLLASVFVAFASLTREYGILLLIPMLLKDLERKGRIVIIQVLLSYLIPIAALVGWVAYLKVETGSWLAIVQSELNWVGGVHENFVLRYWISQVLTLHPINPLNFVESATVCPLGSPQS